MQSETWFDKYGECYRTNGYSKPPLLIYEQFLKAVEDSGTILEVACGNGLLLRYLSDLSHARLEPFGMDINGDAIREAKALTFPDRPECFVHADLREGIPFTLKFTTILANPLYADQGYYEQVDWKIRKLYLDGAIERFVGNCWQAVEPGGRLILWCYDGHVAEITEYAAGFAAALAKTGISFVRADAGPVTFWLSNRKPQ